MEPPSYTLIDAQQRHADYPETFDVPSAAALESLRIGALVKICVEFDPQRNVTTVTPWYRAIWARKVGAAAANRMDGERFWTIVTAIRTDGDAPVYVATIDNDLVYTQHHGLALGDTVTFERRHVLQIYED